MAYPESIDGKVLWVCRENIGRSQVAAALWERKAYQIGTASAGLYVDVPGQQLLERPEIPLTAKYMWEKHKIDMSERKRTRFDDYTTEEIGRAAMVLILAETASIRSSTMDKLDDAGSPWWHLEIADLKDRNWDDTKTIIDEIEKIVDLIGQTFNPDFPYELSNLLE